MRCSLVLSICVLGLIILSASAAADVPQEISYQGRLTDDTGAPVTKPVEITFALYDDSTDGKKIWEESHAGVAVNEGLFSVMLGSIVPLTANLFDGKSRYLKVVVEGNEPDDLIPISSVAYAYRSIISDTAYIAREVDSANHAVWSDTAQYAITSGSTPSSVWEQTATTVYLPDVTDKVGIGTTTPLEKLHVVGNLRMEEGNALKFGAGDAKVRGAVGGDLEVVGQDDLFLQANDKIYLGKVGFAARFVINPTDMKVGFGATAPEEMLHLYNEDDGGTAFVKIQSYHPTNWGEAGIRIETPQNRWHFRMDDNSNNNIPVGALGLRSQSGGLEAMVWTEDGKVGIGTTSPTKRLDVVGDATVSGVLRAGSNTCIGDFKLGGSLVGDLNVTGTIDGDYAANSIDASDILNEVGLNWVDEYSFEDPVSPDWSVHLTQNISVPTNTGYILAFATAELKCLHSAGGMYAQLGISETTDPGIENSSVGLANNVPNGDYTLVLSAHQVFPVDSAGTYTINLVARRVGDAANILGRRLTLLYIPTIYVGKSAEEAAIYESGANRNVSDIGSASDTVERSAELTARIEALERRLAELESK